MRHMYVNHRIQVDNKGRETHVDGRRSDRGTEKRSRDWKGVTQRRKIRHEIVAKHKALFRKDDGQDVNESDDDDDSNEDDSSKNHSIEDDSSDEEEHDRVTDKYKQLVKYDLRHIEGGQKWNIGGVSISMTNNLNVPITLVYEIVPVEERLMLEKREKQRQRSLRLIPTITKDSLPLQHPLYYGGGGSERTIGTQSRTAPKKAQVRWRFLHYDHFYNTTNFVIIETK